MLERDFQAKLIKEIRQRLPGSVVTKIETYTQGFPDLLILQGDRWALLECKRGLPRKSDFQPNQEFYIKKFNRMSFAAIIYPENKEEVLHGLQEAFRSRR